MRKLGTRLALLLLGLVVGLLLVEGVMRVAGLDPLVSQEGLLGTQSGRSECVRPAPWLGYELVPGACRANSLGFRDREPPAVKPSGSLRILALGDSITEQRAWVDMLELLLDRRLEADVDIWNMGVTGYAVLNELELLRRRGLDFEPDLVVLQVCLNDYGVTPVLFRHEGEVQWLRATTGAMDRSTLWLFERSALVRYLKLRGASLHMRGVGDPEHMARVDAALVEMHRLCQERGIPFELVIFPTLAPQDGWRHTEVVAYQRFLELSSAHELPFTDLAPRMLAGDVEDLRRHQSDPVFADLDATLAIWGVGSEAGDLIRGMDRDVLGVGKRIQPHMYDDTTHPNFLGHWLAAEALAGKLAPLLEP